MTSAGPLRQLMGIGRSRVARTVIGEAVALVQDGDGGRVLLRGELVYAWSFGDVALRRLAAVQLVANKAGRRRGCRVRS